MFLQLFIPCFLIDEFQAEHGDMKFIELLYHFIMYAPLIDKVKLLLHDI